jgi:hypothetical protein
MHDAEPLILAELERLAPAAELGRPDWTNVLSRAAVARRPRRAALLVAFAAVAIAVPAVALSSGVRQLLGFGPTPVLSSAKPLVSAPVGNKFFGHAWRGASTTGGSCVFLTHDHTPEVEHPDSFNGGGSCSTRANASFGEASADLPLMLTLGVTRRLKSGVAANWVPPVVSGSVYDKLHATRVAIEWKGGSHELALHNGNFIGGTPKLYMPTFDKFPFAVVAYDTSGKVVARKKLQSPTLLMVNGWKEYARLYNAWKKRHP